MIGRTLRFVLVALQMANQARNRRRGEDARRLHRRDRPAYPEGAMSTYRVKIVK
jgi:hypothetical protein